MREVELKAVVADLHASRRRLEAAGAGLRFAGLLADRRYDTEERALAGRDHVLRLRVYRADEQRTATLDWKGPTRYESGYKVREELSTSVGDPEILARILENMGFVITMEIDREIWQYDLAGTTVRFERYPRMDDLVEVEGAPPGIEAAIRSLGISRDHFTTDRLPDFVRRYQARTGGRAALSQAALEGRRVYDVEDA